MTALLSPTTVEELADAVRAHPRLLAVGAGTKPALSALDGFTRLSTRRLNGIVQYDASEFTFTALAGTPLQDLIAALKVSGQYLPFDPPLAGAGATLGGTVAAGLDGPGRFRFGGLRDFILGVRFVDGEGRLLRMGGKVVKNAAGFDLPKFFVGSLGSFGVLAEITFKVFPCPPATLTLRLPVADAPAMGRLLQGAANTPWEFDALEGSLTERSVLARLRGPAAALASLATEVTRRWPGEILSGEAERALWQGLADFSWAHPDGPCWKIPLTCAALPAFSQLASAIDDARSWIGSGGNVAFLSVPEAQRQAAEQKIALSGFSALTLRGASTRWHGPRRDHRIAGAVKAALDPNHRFPPLHS